MESLRWLGLQWDEGPEVGGAAGPYFQSERLDIYRKYADQLIAEGKAYYCYCSSERLQELRKSQEMHKQKTGYDRLCRNISDDERREKESAGSKRVLRFKTPQSGTTVIHDEIRGDLAFENSTLEDLVLIKSDGFPTYHFANIVDDHLMGVTHVLRGDEWIASAPVHVLLYQAFGMDTSVVHPSVDISFTRRRKAQQAPRGDKREGISGTGISAGGAFQLPASAGMEPWKRSGSVYKR